MVHIDFQKLEDSEVTMEARFTNDPEIEVRTSSLLSPPVLAPQ